MLPPILIIFCVSSFTTVFCSNYEVEKNFCHKDDVDCNGTASIISKSFNKENPSRYLFYDVNPSEGFNLRRDVYRRFAILAKHLAESNDPKLKNFKLVLPPWSHLHHWKYSEQPELIPWGYYFDLESLKQFAPVIEMYQFFEEQPSTEKHVEIDEVYVMKNYEEMFKTGRFVQKMNVYECEEEEHIVYFYYNNISSNDIKCLKFHGPATQLIKVLSDSSANKIMFAHAEMALHPTFGDSLYWDARKSLKYNKELIAVAESFRKAQLKSTNEADGIQMVDKNSKKPSKNSVGGPYLAVHLRRRDFFIGRPKELPSLKYVAKQIEDHLQKLGLSVVFLASDAHASDIEVVQYFLPKSVELVQFKPESKFRDHYKDGGAAIIDQLVCAHARFFIGTADSTFTYRIYEEREILGFSSETTYNVLCANENFCKKPSVWKIV